MKAVLISIQPKWCELIASGKKTVEVRKSAPKLETPFKCYIYMTKSGNPSLEIHDKDGNSYAIEKNYRMAGKVIGEFVCDKVDEFHEWQLEPYGKFAEFEEEELQEFLRKSCLSYKEVCDYRRNLIYCKPLFVWHISELKIYDKPRELNEFRKPCPFPAEDCDVMCPFAIYEYHGNGISGDCEMIGCGNKVEYPPQSWQYVEEA